MPHTQARAIFEEIQARPYRVSEEAGVAANNCYFKGIELLQRLGTHGYGVRGRVGEFSWDMTPIPGDILALEPPDFPSTHFFVELQIDGVWQKLDPSFEPALARHGFQISHWGGDTTCLAITKLYTLEETIAYQVMWSDPDYAARYFALSGPFLKRLNEWLAALSTA